MSSLINKAADTSSRKQMSSPLSAEVSLVTLITPFLPVTGIYWRGFLQQSEEADKQQLLKDFGNKQVWKSAIKHLKQWDCFFSSKDTGCFNNLECSQMMIYQPDDVMTGWGEHDELCNVSQHLKTWEWKQNEEHEGICWWRQTRTPSLFSLIKHEMFSRLWRAG